MVWSPLLIRLFTTTKSAQRLYKKKGCVGILGKKAEAMLSNGQQGATWLERRTEKSPGLSRAGTQVKTQIWVNMSWHSFLGTVVQLGVKEEDKAGCGLGQAHVVDEKLLLCEQFQFWWEKFCFCIYM